MGPTHARLQLVLNIEDTSEPAESVHVMAFLVSIPLALSRSAPSSLVLRKRPSIPIRRPPAACAPPPQPNRSSNVDSSEAAQPETLEEVFLLPADELTEIVHGTMLEGRQLARVYSSDEHGFSNESFFERQIPLGGVPSLVLGRTDAGVAFGGYAANGFLARDDYRESSNERSMFVFTLRDGKLLVAEPTDLVQYDFYDYAVRLGAALLGIPMNPAKHIMKSNMATSSCRLPDGSTSLFGEYTMAKLDYLEVLVAKQFVDQLDQSTPSNEKGFFARLFG